MIPHATFNFCGPSDEGRGTKNHTNSYISSHYTLIPVLIAVATLIPEYKPNQGTLGPPPPWCYSIPVLQALLLQKNCAYPACVPTRKTERYHDEQNAGEEEEEEKEEAHPVSCFFLDYFRSLYKYSVYQ